MDDAELSRIRAARLAELQSSRGQGSQGQGDGGPDNSAEVLAQRHAQLSQILAPSARDRLRRIALVKPDRAQGIEELLLRMAKSGQIRQRVTEDELVGLLTEVSSQDSASTSTRGIKNLRRADDSDDDWN
ncbi:Predicted protein [Taphrina deformans PYCC 5710]|uniref:DNA-binding TFAR19-related protein n=1 Tax=Taphrina deformans (strain PYCC 5710 / ATCC 11124 / CBS 356.35 / IMI 108563 / JCM 9778 / NBRC 8474) TaxID=1097556 RepID=R4XDC2_TAPDE|nr:Predicted protein [Taphrina deformans PYCC 5710]|eukprot:CCG81339.1 Predicted protein [Taphrina deformans PYCC 5710]